MDRSLDIRLVTELHAANKSAIKKIKQQNSRSFLKKSFPFHSIITLTLSTETGAAGAFSQDDISSWLEAISSELPANFLPPPSLLNLLVLPPPKFLGKDLLKEDGLEGVLIMLRSEEDWEFWERPVLATSEVKLCIELPAESILLGSSEGFVLKSTARVLNADAGVV